MTLADIIADHESRSKRLTVANRDEPEPIVRMLERMVDAPDVEVVERDAEALGAGYLVLLEDDDADEPQLAVSTIESVGNSVLMVNSDLYITGTRPIEDVDTPEVLTGLAETTFTVSEKRKMLLIEISRHIESLAFRYGDGRLHTGFQSIGRIDDERGTRRVYEKLATETVDVHLYGSDDADEVPKLPAAISTHTADDEELRRTWFVVSSDCPDDRKAALLAREIGPNEWTGFWTFDPAVVDRVDRYLRDEYWA